MSQHRLQIGYALLPKKVQSFILPSLVDYAKQHGVDLIRIDLSKPLVSQGPFDCIAHKLYGKDWNSQLDEFSSRYPSVPIVDPPQFIQRLHDRVSMLDVVAEVRISQENCVSVCTPSQVVVSDAESLMGLYDSCSQLKFPVIAKPLVADGSANSHQMYLVFNKEGFNEVSAPVVIQEFVNHGGVIFKVYVVGKYVQCEKRKSLPDITEESMGSSFSGNAMSFSQISNLVGGEDDEQKLNLERAEMPPLEFVEELASELRVKMGLNLFNFDLIRDASDKNRYLVIDINYFPGYAKMPNYESVLTEFFKDIVNRHKNVTENSDGKENSVVAPSKGVEKACK